MEAIPAGNVQNVDGETSQSTTDCLRLPTKTFQKILQHFSNSELLLLSLVNKEWNCEARSLMRDRGSLVANLKIFLPCANLQSFPSDLQAMNVVPFAGMSIILSGWNHNVDTCQKSPPGPMDPIYQTVLDKLPWKYLSVRFLADWERFQNCPTFLLVQEVFCKFSQAIEEMFLSLDSPGAEFIREVFTRSEFPSLKTLRLGGISRYSDEQYTEFIQVLISRAPNLQEFYPEGIIRFTSNVLEGSSAVIVTDYEVNPLNGSICEGIASALRLERMTLDAISPDFSVRKFNTVVPRLLETSRITLNSLCIDAMFAVPLMCYGVCLENLRELEIRLDYYYLDSIDPRSLTLLKTFDFTRISPQLDQVSIVGDSSDLLPDQILEFVAQGNVTPKEPLPDRADNITRLSVSDFLNNDIAQFLSEMFPKIQTLSVAETSEGPDIPYEFIRNHWVDLKELDVQKL